MTGSGLDLRSTPEFRGGRPPRPRLAALDDDERGRRAAADPAWGEMICRCEHVARAEVEAALANPFGARSLDAIKRRTRCGMGRCQGGFCTPRLVELLETRGLEPADIRKRGAGSNLFYGRIKP
jgi:glycerol-3-phosphate dehydrogenase